MLTKSNCFQFIAAFILIAPSIGFSGRSLADHVPDDLSQDVNPNYVGCMMAVDDADTIFLSALQMTCIERAVDTCSGVDGAAPKPQVIECLYFETRRGVNFIKAAADALPATFEKDGFFAHSYSRHRNRVLKDADILDNSPKPLSLETAFQNTVLMATAVVTLFWLARETGTSLNAYADAPFEDH